MRVRCVVCVVTLGRRVCVGCAALVGVSLVVHVQKKKKRKKEIRGVKNKKKKRKEEKRNVREKNKKIQSNMYNRKEKKEVPHIRKKKTC